MELHVFTQVARSYALLLSTLVRVIQLLIRHIGDTSTTIGVCYQNGWKSWEAGGWEGWEGWEGASHGILCTWWLLRLSLGRAWLPLASLTVLCSVHHLQCKLHSLIPISSTSSCQTTWLMWTEDCLKRTTASCTTFTSQQGDLPPFPEDPLFPSPFSPFPSSPPLSLSSLFSPFPSSPLSPLFLSSPFSLCS